jgi:hypothetical protein
VSHFTVAVISDSPDEVDDLLAPFQENNMGDCPKEYLKFNDNEDEYLKEFETETIDRIKGPDGTFYSPHDGRFQLPMPAEVAAKAKTLRWSEQSEYLRELYPNGYNQSGDKLTYRSFEGYEKVNVPIKEAFATLDDYVSDYHGSERDEETGRYGYWENPNCKWDWYQIGGRWQGMLRAKPDAVSYQGETSAIAALNEDVTLRNCDQVRVGDLDLEAMLKEAQDNRGKMWDEAVTAFHLKRSELTDAECPLVPADFNEARDLWKSICDKLEKTEDPEAPALYQKIEKDTQALLLRKVVGHVNDHWSFSIPDDVRDRQTYIDGAAPFSTFAVLMNGEWHEKGSMGWFGMVSDEKDDWNIKFKELIQNLPADKWITIVDCHI